MEAGARRPQARWIGVAALLAAVVRLPFLGRPLTSDEGGYLMVAAQWHPGTSLYGDYWVDRPPLLVALFGLADAAGGAVGLRLLGVVVAVGAVLLAAWIGRVAATSPCRSCSPGPVACSPHSRRAPGTPVAGGSPPARSRRRRPWSSRTCSTWRS